MNDFMILLVLTASIVSATCVTFWFFYRVRREISTIGEIRRKIKEIDREIDSLRAQLNALSVLLQQEGAKK